MSDKESKFLFYLTNLHKLYLPVFVVSLELILTSFVALVAMPQQRGHYCLIDKTESWTLRFLLPSLKLRRMAHNSSRLEIIFVTMLWTFLWSSRTIQYNEHKVHYLTLFWCCHCCSIGYPVVTLGYGVKSYVGYKMRQVSLCNLFLVCQAVTHFWIPWVFSKQLPFKGTYLTNDCTVLIVGRRVRK